MEKSRAIELLKLAVPIKALTQQEYADFVEAVNMGMDALEQPTSPDTIDRKAALDALRRCQTYLYDARDPELKIELSSAEAAIKELPTIQPEKAQLLREGTTSDLISRQAAIDEIKSVYEWHDTVTMERLIEHINNLPPAQPEKRTEKRTETHACDLISRQAAIDALDVLCQEHRYRIPGKRETYSEYNEAWQDALGRAEGVIGNLPTIQPEPAIPLSWIEKHIEWHKSLDNEFANLAAAHISVMVKKWRDEQDETD